MAKKKTNEKKVKRYLELPNGDCLLIIDEDGVYWYCEGGSQFFKHLGYRVITEPVEEDPEPPQEEEQK